MAIVAGLSSDADLLFLDELRHLTRTSITVETERPVDELVGRAGVHDITRENGRAHFDVDGEHLGGTIAYLSGLGIRSLISRPPTLEQLFLRHYGVEETEVAR